MFCVAIRKAVVNALIHADHRGQGGVVIERYADRIDLSNPGCSSRASSCCAAA